MTWFREMERILKSQNDMYLEQALYYYGIDIKRIIPDKNVHSDVYGTFAGNNGTTQIPFRGIVAGDDFFPEDNAYAGNFIEGYCYTKENLLPSDILEVDSADGKVRRYRVELPLSIGTQDTVFKKYKLTNLGD
jgi:hypothetical protein